MTYEFGHPCCTDEYPPHEEIPPRCFEPLDSEKELRSALGHGFRENQKVTMTVLLEAKKNIEKWIDYEVERYERIRELGDKAMSETDLMMDYTAQNSGLPLTYAHIGYSRGQLRIVDHWIKKLNPQGINIKKGEQRGLF